MSSEEALLDMAWLDEAAGVKACSRVGFADESASDRKLLSCRKANVYVKRNNQRYI